LDRPNVQFRQPSAYDFWMVSKFVAMGLVAALLGLVGVALFRPAALFGVDSKALANSLSGEVNHAQAKCVGEGPGRWRCALRGGSVGGVEYTLTTHRFGCWTGSQVGMAAAAGGVDQSVSGCIGLTDMFGN
jgi:hypothetical protein